MRRLRNYSSQYYVQHFSFVSCNCNVFGFIFLLLLFNCSFFVFFHAMHSWSFIAHQTQKPHHSKWKRFDWIGWFIFGFFVFHFLYIVTRFQLIIISWFALRMICNSVCFMMCLSFGCWYTRAHACSHSFPTIYHTVDIYTGINRNLFLEHFIFKFS